MQVRVWDVHSLQCLSTLTGHSGAVRALSASSTRVFSGSDDTTIKARSLTGPLTLCCLAPCLPCCVPYINTLRTGHQHERYQRVTGSPFVVAAHKHGTKV